jgi:hypothetical protein
MPTGDFLDRSLRLWESLGRKKGSLEHVAIVVVPDWYVEDVGVWNEERETAKVQEFFKLALDKGAQFLQYDGYTSLSAQTILRRVIQRFPDGGEGFVNVKPRRCPCEGAMCVLAAFPVILWGFYYMVYCR